MEVDGKIFFQILVPTYNSALTIRNALNSIVCQTFDSWICIVLDDHSDDNTFQIVQEYVEKYPDKFAAGQIDKRVPTGEVRNGLLKKGLEFNTPYTLWLDSDDTFHDCNVFQNLHDRLKETSYPDVLQLSYKIIFDNDGQEEFREAKSISVGELALDGRWTAPWSKCVKTKLMGKFLDGLFRFEDTFQHFKMLDGAVRTVNFYNNGEQQPAIDYHHNRTRELEIDVTALDQLKSLLKTCVSEYVRKGVQETINYWNEVYDKIKNHEPEEHGEDNMGNNDVKVIVALTTHGIRLKTNAFLRSLESILKQKTSFKTKICLTLFKDDVKLLTQRARDFIRKHGIEIIQAPLNLRPHLKYFYVMTKYKDLPVITVDDDCYYEDILVESLYREHLKFPKSVIAKRVHKITYFTDGVVRPYKEWLFEYNGNSGNGEDLLVTGVGGVLYPPSILKLETSCLDEITKCSLTNDDIWMRKRETELGVPVRWIPPKRGNKDSYIPASCGRDSSALCLTENLDGNDTITKLLKMRKSSSSIAFNIIYITDTNYVVPMLHSIRSLKQNVDRDKNYVVNVVCDSSVSGDQKRDIESLNSPNVQIKIKNIPAEFEKSLNKISQVNKVAKCATYKFYLANLFRELDVALYVDCDTLILRDISQIFNAGLYGRYCAAVRDYKVCRTYESAFHRGLVAKYKGYFNSGVMLLNLFIMRRQNVGEQLFKYRIGGVNKFMDQDALNVVFNGRVNWLNCNWNFIASNLLFKPSDISKFYSVKTPATANETIQSPDVKILHITGVEKPWKNHQSEWYEYWNKFNDECCSKQLY